MRSAATEAVSGAAWQHCGNVRRLECPVVHPDRKWLIERDFDLVPVWPVLPDGRRVRALIATPEELESLANQEWERGDNEDDRRRSERHYRKADEYRRLAEFKRGS